MKYSLRINELKKYPSVIALITAFSIIFILGLPFTEWWFTGDDFHGIFLGYKTKTWSELLNFFTDGHTNQGVGIPGGYVIGKPDFLGAYYRPLYCIYLALQFWTFGTQGYGYFLCNVIAHAIASGLLFYLFARYTSRYTAFLAALLFAFHPQIAYRFGAVVNFHYYVNVVLVLCIAIALRKYLLRLQNNHSSIKNYLPLIAALFCYALSLLTRETTIILPAVIGILLLAKDYAIQNKPQWTLIIKICFIFGFIALAFICLRLYLYPLKTIATNGTFIPYAAKGNFAAHKFQEFLVFFYDLLFLSWLPWGNKILKIVILTPLLSLLGYTFFLCRQKIVVCSFFICGILMLWPGIISFYSPRYIYESMPFFLAGFVTIFATSNLNYNFKKLLKIIISCFIIALAFFCFTAFQAREKKLHTMHNAITNLCHYPNINNRALCFLTTPSDGGPGPQLFWILFNDRHKKIYFDSALILTQRDSNIVKSHTWFNAIAPYYDKNYVFIKNYHQTFEFLTINENKIVFESTDAYRSHRIGNLEVLHKKNGAITLIKIVIDNDIFASKPLLINWNYETKNFDLFELEGI